MIVTCGPCHWSSTTPLGTTGLPFEVATAIVLGEATTMGDKSPKSKQRDEKQKDAAKAAGAAAARSKQASQSHTPTLMGKGKK